MTRYIRFNPTGGRRESQIKPIHIVIHFEDYIDTSIHHPNTAHTNSDLEENKIISFPDLNKVNREYIGSFVDQLMEMPDDPYQNIGDDPVQGMSDPLDVVAARILSEEKW